MTKKIHFTLNHDPAHVVVHAKAAASKNGVRLEGDELAGHFSGHGIEGQYRVKEGVMSITIKRKPLLVPWSMIEHRLLEFFTEGIT